MNADGTNPTRITNDPALSGRAELAAHPAYPGYVRPKRRLAFALSLVPAYAQCTAPNSAHGAAARVRFLQPAFGAVGQGDGRHLDERLRSLHGLLGNPATPADEADVALRVQISDVREQGTLADYTGEVQPRTIARLTDRTGSGGTAGTVSDSSSRWTRSAPRRPPPTSARPARSTPRSTR